MEMRQATMWQAAALLARMTQLHGCAACHKCPLYMTYMRLGHILYRHDHYSLVTDIRFVLPVACAACLISFNFNVSAASSGKRTGKRTVAEYQEETTRGGITIRTEVLERETVALLCWLQCTLRLGKDLRKVYWWFTSIQYKYTYIYIYRVNIYLTVRQLQNKLICTEIRLCF